MLKWAIDNHCGWDPQTRNNAVAGGHIDIVMYLFHIDSECKWDLLTSAAAAQSGRLEMFKWADANGCAWRYPKVTNHHLICATKAIPPLSVILMIKTLGLFC